MLHKEILTHAQHATVAAASNRIRWRWYRKKTPIARAVFVVVDRQLPLHLKRTAGNQRHLIENANVIQEITRCNIVAAVDYDAEIVLFYDVV